MLGGLGCNLLSDVSFPQFLRRSVRVRVIRILLLGRCINRQQHVDAALMGSSCEATEWLPPNLAGLRGLQAAQSFGCMLGKLLCELLRGGLLSCTLCGVLRTSRAFPASLLSTLSLRLLLLLVYLVIHLLIYLLIYLL